MWSLICYSSKAGGGLHVFFYIHKLQVACEGVSGDWRKKAREEIAKMADAIIFLLQRTDMP